MVLFPIPKRYTLAAATLEAAKILGITDRHVRWLIAEGIIPAERVGARLWLIPEIALAGVKLQRKKKVNGDENNA